MTPPAPVQFTAPEPPRTTRGTAKARIVVSEPVDGVLNTPVEDVKATEDEFKSENPDHRRTFGWVSLEDLVVDPAYQRPENLGEINKIARKFKKEALGTVTLSARVDPTNGEITYILIDGQQRRAGALKAGYTGQVRADVHHNLTPADEARLFELLNFRSAVSPVYLFRAALIQGDPGATAVQKILDDLGVPFGTPKGYSGAASSRRLVARKNGETTLRWALAQVQKIYDADRTGGVYDAGVVEAFYWLYDKFGPRIDEDNLYSKLAKVGGGTADLVGYAKTIKSVRGGRIGLNLIRAIIARYNLHKSANSRARLPDWTDTPAAQEVEAAE